MVGVIGVIGIGVEGVEGVEGVGGEIGIGGDPRGVDLMGVEEGVDVVEVVVVKLVFMGVDEGDGRDGAGLEVGDGCAGAAAVGREKW